jgi:hypothetical protein
MADEVIPPVPILCACGVQICEEIYVQGIVLLHAGGGLWHELHGVCAQCGAAFHWSIKNAQLQQVVQREQISPADQPGDE